MKNLFLMATLSTLTLALSTSAFAQGRYTCTPSDRNSYFTDNLSLTVVDNSRIELNNVKLDRDSAYKPGPNLKDFARYNGGYGDTAAATGWQDSGLVEVLVKQNVKVLRIRVRGEMYISEDFSCKAE